MKYYSLFSKSQQRYNVPFLAHDDEEAVAIVAKMVASSSDMSMILSLSDLELCIIGEFDGRLLSPMTEYEEPNHFLDNLHTDLPLPPLLRSHVDTVYKNPLKVGDNVG